MCVLGGILLRGVSSMLTLWLPYAVTFGVYSALRVNFYGKWREIGEDFPEIFP